MDKKIRVCLVAFFLGATLLVVAQADFQTRSLKIPEYSTRVRLKQNNGKQQQGQVLGKKDLHSYKIAAVGLIGAAGIAAAIGFWYLKNQQEERRQTKELYTKIAAYLKPLKYIDDQNIKNILSGYSKKIQHKALFEQDEDGNTIIHHVMNVHKDIKTNGDYTNHLSSGQQSPSDQTESAIKVIIQACDDNDMKIRLLNTRNNKGLSAYHAIYKQFSNKVRCWDHGAFLLRMNKDVSKSSDKRLRLSAKVEWSKDYKPTLVALQ